MKEWSEVLYHKISNPIIELLVALKITPNQVTILNHTMTLTFGVWFFSRGTWLGYIQGLGVCLINGLLDYIDGDLAKRTGKCSQAGEWLDTGFDVIIQNAVMGSIALGCFKQELNILWILLYFIGNAGLNLVSFNYNNTFGFRSKNGNQLFRSSMDKKPTVLNLFLRDLIDPTASKIGLFLYTVRYWIVLGALTNKISWCLIALVFITNIRWALMYLIYGAHLQKYNKLWVNQVLSILDEERQEYYAIRNSKKV